ncbi:hypothetical protein DYB30_002979 [Aphanomyces astaci]|uniref:Uncharacterized protein n=1 Tax=Aphanomyces astaci TaxID=112090 RepID=A0A397DD35_APHAT|nr:hypothetical protein DYB30_002979 [Aphanomyces astaci]
MSPPRVAPRRSVYTDVLEQPHNTTTDQPSSDASSFRVYVEILLGYSYMLLSLGCSFYYMHIVTPYLANDMRLREFNQSGGLSFLVDLANSHWVLPTLNATAWDITHTAFVKDYSSDATRLTNQPAYARRMLLEDTRLEAAIGRMMRASIDSLMNLPTQYCWVDFKQVWELAHTKRRQARCRLRDIDNAAVYLEATLRLADWARWQLQVGRCFTMRSCQGYNQRSKAKRGYVQYPAQLWSTSTLKSILGPFLSIDMRYVPLPEPLVAVYDEFLSTVHPVWRLPAYLALADIKLDPIPVAWTATSTAYFGGNPFCVESPAYFQQNFGFDTSCDEVQRYALQVDRTSVLFALALTKQHDAHASNLCALCEDTVDECVSFVQDATRVMALLLPLLQTNTLSLRRSAALESIQHVEIVQLVKQPRNASTISLVRHAVADDDDAWASWSFFGWVMIYDWIRGHREVVSLEGDLSTLTLISGRYDLITFEVDPNDIPTRTGFTLWCLLQYVSLALTGIASLVVAYSLLNRFSVIGRNLFRFNRVAGCVWIGRPLLLTRGVSAVLLLSASNFDLLPDTGVTTLAPRGRTWVESMVVSGEALWLVYVVQDFIVVALHEAQWTGPVASIVTWIVLVMVDVWTPYDLSAVASRHCVATAGGHSCTMGTIYASSVYRVCLTLGVMFLAIVGSVCAGKVWTAWSKNPPVEAPVATLLLPAAIGAFMDVPVQVSAGAQTMDTITCVLAGLFPLVRTGHTSLFDVKLRRFVPCDMVSQLIHVRSPTFAPVNTDLMKHANQVNGVANLGPHAALVRVATKSRRAAWLHRFQVACSFAYMAITLWTSVSFVQLSTASVGNDLFWDDFNSSGTHTFLANWLNLELLAPRTANVLAVDYIDTAMYNSSDSIIHMSPFYANWIQYEEGRNVTRAVQGLRRMGAIDALWISTQYCWLDFHQKWTMANSALRQARCDRMRTNGAVYLESILRNVPWNVWRGVARDPYRWLDAFDMAFVAELNMTMQGQSWWAQVQRASLSVHDEVRWWHDHGIVAYTTQWQNYKTIGIDDSFAVQNAMGLSYALTLKLSNGSYRAAYQTSLKTTLPLVVDLLALVVNSSRTFGTSLLRQSANFAYRNVTVSHVMALSPTAYLSAVMNNFIGPFGSVDSRHVPRPPTLMALYRRVGLATMSAVMQFPQSNAIFMSIPSMKWSLKGYEAWERANILIEGGDLMCGASMETGLPAVGGCLESFGLTMGCYVQRATLDVDRHMLLFAFLSWTSAYPTASVNVSYVCSGRDTDSTCPDAMTTVMALSSSMNVSSVDAYHDVQELVVGLTQFILVGKARQFLFMPMLNPRRPQFDLFAWCLLYEWVLGYREVVNFQGDRGNLTVMSAKYPDMTWHTNEAEIPRHIVYFLRAGIAYVTTILAFVASLVLVYTLANRGHIEPRNILHFNRIAGFVWVGRPLLFARSVVALTILSTSKAQLVRVAGHFNAMQLPESNALYYMRTVLSSSEACWLVYVLQDILTIFTRDRTQVNASRASILVWVVSAVLSCVYPVQPKVTVARDCEYAVVDLQLTCHSGTIAIGDYERLVLLVLIVVGSVVLCAGLQWLCTKEKSNAMPSYATSLFLCNGAKTLFRNKDHWTLDQVVYLDMVSAVLNGLVIFPWKRTFYVLDIKTWRSFAVDAPPFHLTQKVPNRFRHSFCLTE